MVGRLKPKMEIHSPNGNIKTRWAEDKNLKQYDSMMSRYMAESNAWRFAGLVSLVLLALSLGTLIYTIHLPKRELVVVSVNDIGKTKYIGSTKGVSLEEFGMKDACVKNILEDFIKRTYLITSDSDLMYQNYKNCLYFLDSKKRKSYMITIKAEDPFKEVGRIKRFAQIETIIPISPNSYQCDFFVNESELTGFSSKEKKMRAIFSLSQLDSEGYSSLTEEERVNNPLGIFITDYNIVEVK